ncbi:MAG: NADH:ubiquinone oxidoreductase [Thermoprotei archaeon]
MTNFWFLNGLKKGVKTERFPAAEPEEPPVWPSRLKGSGSYECPTDAIVGGEWIQERCIFCRRCVPSFTPTQSQNIYHIRSVEPMFRKSFYLYPVDSGACGACNTEFFNIFSPQYDANRLGIFMTNTPRHADAIVVMGVGSPGMAEALERAYEAMPSPKLIIALGVCALTGGVMGNSPMNREKYNVEIAGCPPSPYTIISAIMAAKEKKGEM